jgi:23S rRNA pseudouridine2604 synthase
MHVRINKYLALQKISTRRGADELIKGKKVFINGKLAELGSQVNEGDRVEVKGAKPKEYLYFAYNKQIGTETASPKEGLFPLGRLDKASHGLMILTNDGRITDQLLNPKYFHEKEYLVKTKEKLRSNFKQKHQIRRMCSALFQEVADLKRERIMNIKLGNLRPNSLREIKEEELKTFLEKLYT